MSNTNLMRQTVYIPDDLLQRAQALLPDVNPSKLVQRGLARLVEDFQGPVYVNERLEAVASEIVRLRDHFAIEARAEYERGYRKALAAADSLSWRVLEELAENHNDLKRVLRPYLNGSLQDAMNAKPISPEQVDELLRKRDNDEPNRSTQNTERKETEWSWLERLAHDLGSIADPVGYDVYSFDPTRAFLRGYGDALYEVWAAVEEGIDPSRHVASNPLPDVRQGSEFPNAGGS